MIFFLMILTKHDCVKVVKPNEIRKETEVYLPCVWSRCVYLLLEHQKHVYLQDIRRMVCRPIQFDKQFR